MSHHWHHFCARETASNWEQQRSLKYFWQCKRKCTHSNNGLLYLWFHQHVKQDFEVFPAILYAKEARNHSNRSVDDSHQVTSLDKNWSWGFIHLSRQTGVSLVTNQYLAQRREGNYLRDYFLQVRLTEHLFWPKKWGEGWHIGQARPEAETPELSRPSISAKNHQSSEFPPEPRGHWADSRDMQYEPTHKFDLTIIPRIDP